MDDLDDDLFDSLLKSKSPSTGKTVPSTRGKTKDDFDEDDPLAGLLPDDFDNNSPAVKKTVAKSKNDGFQNPKEATSLSPDLPESPRSAGRRRNALDDLLSKSDVAKAAERSTEPAKQGFVLGDQYRSFKSSEETSKGSGVTEQQKESNIMQFGGYTPSVDSKVTTRRRAAPSSAIPSANVEKDILGDLFNSELSSSGAALKQGQGRRGKEDDNNAITAGQTIGNLPRPTKNRNSDWLELKEESLPVVTKTSQTSVIDDKSVPPQARRPRKETKVTLDEELLFNEKNAETTVVGGKLSDKSQSSVVEKMPVLKVPESNMESSQTKKDNFLEWLGAKKNEQPIIPTSKPEIVQSTVREATNDFEKDTIQIVTSSQNVPRFPSASNERTLPETDHLSSVRLEYEKTLSNMRSQMADLHTKFSEESLAASASLLELQTKVRRLEFERNQLAAALEGLESRHKNELLALETSFKKRTQLIEESYQRREHRLQEELDTVSRVQMEKQNAWEQERSEIIANWQRRVDEAASDRIADLDRIREHHRCTIAGMKKDHDLAITRLQQIKEIEFSAVTEAQSHSKTLQLVIDQLKNNTTELGQLQMKVEGGFHAGLEEREMLLETKDRQLKMLQGQLKKQQEDNEQERVMLRQLIKRLEDRLHQQTLGLEEERWKLLQDRNKLEADQKVLEESQKLSNEKLEQERLQLKKAKDLFLEEQKSVIHQMYTEKQKLLASPPVQLSHLQLSSTVLEKEIFDGFHNIKAQAQFEASLRASEEEKAKLIANANQLKSEVEQLAEERLAFTSQQAELEEEKSAINALAIQVKRHTEETEEMCLAAVQTREEGLTALHEANQLKIELQKRQEAVKEHFEALKSREQRLAEQRLSLADQRRHLEHLRSKLLCVRCQSPIDWNFQQPTPTATFKLFNKEHLLPSHCNQQSGFEAWHIAAEKDKEYLAQERLFLQSLKTNFNSPL